MQKNIFYYWKKKNTETIIALTIITWLIAIKTQSKKK